MSNGSLLTSVTHSSLKIFIRCLEKSSAYLLPLLNRPVFVETKMKIEILVKVVRIAYYERSYGWFDRIMWPCYDIRLSEMILGDDVGNGVCSWNFKSYQHYLVFSSVFEQWRARSLRICSKTPVYMWFDGVLWTWYEVGKDDNWWWFGVWCVFMEF